MLGLAPGCYRLSHITYLNTIISAIAVHQVLVMQHTLNMDATN